MNTTSIAIILAYLSMPYVDADTLVPIDIRPWACQKRLHRTARADVPVAIFTDATGQPSPQHIKNVVIEGWLKPTRTAIFTNPKFCAVRTGIAGREVLVAWFPRNFILNLYDASPYSFDRVIAVLRLQADVIDPHHRRTA